MRLTACKSTLSSERTAPSEGMQHRSKVIEMFLSTIAAFAFGCFIGMAIVALVAGER